ncbi:MAG TPA: response regulator [Vicinamibacterales bacterium]|nr:response regulator [Vicinamibacterales bacterium]
MVKPPGDEYDWAHLQSSAQQLSDQARLYADLSAALQQEAERLRALAQNEGLRPQRSNSDSERETLRSASIVPVILIADDDDLTTELFARGLRAQGYIVKTASTTEEATREVEGRRFDAIIMDLHIPHPNGLAALRSLRSMNCAIPCAIITGDYSLDDATTTAIHELGAELRFKPLNFDELRDLADTLVRGRGP